MTEYNLENDLFEERAAVPEEDTSATRELREMFSFAKGVANSLISTPTLSENVIYLPSSDHHLYAIKAQTGEIIWKFLTGGILAHSPVIYNGVIFLGSTDCNLYALDAKTGTERWHFRTGDMIPTMPLVLPDRIIFGSFDNHVYAVSHEGKELWKIRLGGVPQGQPLCVGRTLFIGATDGRMHAIDMNGKKLWSYFIGNTGVASPVYSKNTNSLIFTSWNGYVHSMTLDGRTLWKYQCDGSAPVRYPWEISEGLIYIGSGDFQSGALYVINVRDGRLAWKFQTGGRVQGARIFKNMILCSSMEGKFYALDMSGKCLWTFQSDGSVMAPAMYFNGLILACSWNGHLYCLDEKGELVWKIYFPGQPGDFKQVFSPIQRIADRVRSFLRRWRPEKAPSSAYETKAAAPQLSLGPAAYKMSEPYKSEVGYKSNAPAGYEMKREKKKDWRDPFAR